MPSRPRDFRRGKQAEMPIVGGSELGVPGVVPGGFVLMLLLAR